MLLHKYMKSSKVIELIEEGSNEDASMHKALVRVLGSPQDWSKLLVSILMSPDDDSDFAVSIRKEYYISEQNDPTFVWVIVIWGDLLEAAAEIGPIIQMASPAQDPVPPAKAPLSRAAEANRTQPPSSQLRRRTIRSDDGVRTVTTVPLPFKRGNRDNPNTTRTLGSKKGVGAYVSNVTGGEGL